MDTGVNRRSNLGTKVAKSRLIPALKRILGVPRNNERVPDEVPGAGGPGYGHSSQELLQKLDLALRSYVFDRMPVRLLLLPEMQLIERHDIFRHIKNNIGAVGDTCLEETLTEIGKISQHDLTEQELKEVDPNEEDVREAPLERIFEFLFSEYGRYTILSHTWLHNDPELTYQDTRSPGWPSTYEKTVGYWKIKGFCDVAQTDNISLSWIDTMCINKDSSAELDESILSMYRWYKESALCTTYLHHTLIPTDLTGSGKHSEDQLPLLEADLESSRMTEDTWFIRGWTLQELLASRCMKFYDRNWKAIQPHSDNDKAGPVLQDVITRITGIDR